ncbi:MAG: CARDB domain-containing protein [Pseudomonadota bacterium]
MTLERLSASSYGVQYVEGPQSLDVDALAAAPHEVLILEPLNLAPGYDAAVGAADVDTLQAAGKQVFLYMSVGETSDLRRYWDVGWTNEFSDLGPPPGAAPNGGRDVLGRTEQAPIWLSDYVSGASFGAARLVQYWQSEWLEILKDEIDFLLGDLGADGLFLDNVASYFEWFTFDSADAVGLNAPAFFYAQEMARLVGEIADHIQTNHPGAKIIANGNPFLPFDTADRAGLGQLFLDSISAMMQEGVYHSGGERYDNAVTRNALKDIVAAEGIPILALDYVDPGDQAKIDAFVKDAVNDGFLPYADELNLALDGLQAALNQPSDDADRLFLPDVGGVSVDARGGDDAVFGGDGDDEASGGDGNDVFYGGDGEDVWRVTGNRAQAVVSASQSDPDGPVLLTLSGDQGVDDLHDVETVAFDDQTVPISDLLAAPLGPDGVPTILSVERLDTPNRVLVRWRVDNLGDETLPAGSLAVQMVDAQGGAPRARNASVSVAELVPGAFAEGSAGFTLPNGTFTPRLIYDAPGSVSESDEGNNTVTDQPLTVGGAQNLAVTQVRLDNAQAGAQGLILVDVDVVNLGDAASAPELLRLLLAPQAGGDPIPLLDRQIGALDPAGVFGLTGGLPLSLAQGLAAGDYVLRAVIDPDGLRDETDESDDALDSAEVFRVVTGPANLAIDDLQFDDAAVDRSDEPSAVDFSFRLFNDGGDDAPATRVAVELVPEGGGDAVLIQQIDAPALTSGEPFTVLGDGLIPQGLPAGAYALRVTVDADGALAEADEADNQALSTGRLSVADGEPDIAVSAVTVETAGPVAGGDLDLTWSLDNPGTAFLDAGEIAIRLAVAGASDAVELARVAYDPLPARAGGAARAESARVTLPRDLQGGAYVISVVVDPDGLIDETDEANNIGVQSGPLQIAALPNGAASDLTLTTAQPTQGQLLEFDWTLANPSASTLAQTPFIVELIPDGAASGAEIQRRGAGALDPQGSVVVEEQLTLAADTAPGDYILRVTFDPDDAIDEADETDNAVELAITVAASSLFSKFRDVVTLEGPGAVRAGGGADLVRGGPWDDEIYGQRGDDRLLGRGGDDALYGGGGADELIGGRGADQAWGGGGGDLLKLNGGADRGWGGGGGDRIEGAGGRDALNGGGGRDEIFGGGGRDRLSGDKGADLMRGGGGGDVFLIGRRDGDDRIADFGGRDRVDLSEFGFADAGRVLARLSRDGRHTELDLPGPGDLTFLRTRPGELDAGDFIL